MFVDLVSQKSYVLYLQFKACNCEYAFGRSRFFWHLNSLAKREDFRAVCLMIWCQKKCSVVQLHSKACNFEYAFGRSRVFWHVNRLVTREDFRSGCLMIWCPKNILLCSCTSKLVIANMHLEGAAFSGT